MADDGVLAFITNRSFIESRTFDGFRKAVEQEFNEIYVVDLGGDVRANPKLSGTKHNVFGIQTGVAISFLVKRHKQTGCKIFYARRPEMDTADDKLAFLSSTKASAISFDRVEPDKKGNWINLTENGWDDLIPVAKEDQGGERQGAGTRQYFGLFSLGLDHTIVTIGSMSSNDANSSVKSRRIFAQHYDGVTSTARASRLAVLPMTALNEEIKWTS